MEEKLIYISNEPVSENSALEETMVGLAEELNAKILIRDFSESSKETLNAPIIVMCNGINVEDEAVLDNIEKLYLANQHIILYKPTNNEINTVYERLEGRNYFKADNKISGYSLFGLKKADDGLCYVLEDHEKDSKSISQNMKAFLEDKQEVAPPLRQMLSRQAAKALGIDSLDVNLATMAKQHVATKNFTLQGKPCSLSYYMVSCHKYEGTSAAGGEDWFFIQQYGILNGAPGYDKHWAGTRVDVNGESWYVGQGEVCLNYVDYYKMQNYIPIPQGKDKMLAKLVYADPQAINNTTSYTISEDIELGGTIGFEGSAGKEGAELKGNGSFSAGAKFSSSYSFEVRDCTCKGTSLSTNSASAEWEYSFKRAAQNRAAGKWQYLHNPADLACSVFSPLNSWIWKFDTKERDTYKGFTSKIEIGIMNTISRYSGSQSPKNIAGKCRNGEENNVSFDITFHLPPLLGVDKRSILFDNEGGTQKLNIAVQGSFTIEIKGAPEWLRTDIKRGSGENTEVLVSADKFANKGERHAILQIRRIKDEKRNTTDELIEVKVAQTAGKIS